MNVFFGGFIFTVEQVCLFVTLPPLISTSWLAKSTVQEKTQQHKTHNNQHEMPPPSPPATLPSPSMSRTKAPPTHGVTASYGPMLVPPGLVWRCHGWFLSFGMPSHTPSKNRARDVTFALSGQNLKGRHNNQPSVGISGGREYGEVARGGRITWGNTVPLFGTSNGATQK